MKQITICQAKCLKLLTLITILLFFSNCSKDCKPETFNKNVNESYLPDIMPYSDTSTRLFLKNRKDTLLFKSLGINKQIIKDDDNVEGCDIYNLEELTLLMSASDTDYFLIKYYAIRDGVPSVKIRIGNSMETSEYPYNNFRRYYPPIISIDILNTRYDTVNILNTYNNLCTIYSKPKIGILKFQTPTNVYELIK